MPEIISVRERPEYEDKATNYISAKWDIDNRIMYHDCISHSICACGPLPQWYLLLRDNEIIGCAGLVTNDFISRMDLYPWLCALYIEEGQRGNFFSRLLIEKAKDDTKKGGFKKLYLSTEHMGLYEKLDFEYIGEGYHPWGGSSRIYQICV